MDKLERLLLKVKSTSLWAGLCRHCLSHLAAGFHDYVLNARGKLERSALSISQEEGEELRRHGFQPFCSPEVVRLAAKIREDIGAETIEATRVEMRRSPHGMSARRGIIPLDLSRETTMALLKLATSDEVLKPIISYLGVVPKIHHIGATLSTPGQCTDEEVGSEKWHRDANVYRSPTLYIYLTDVDAGSGPFHMISKEHLCSSAILPVEPARRLKEASWNYWYRERYSDAEIKRYVADSRLQKMLGPTGTGFIVDQGAFYHKGGYCKSKERILLQINYVTEAKYDRVQITSLFESLSDRDKAEIRTSDLIDYLFTPSSTVFQKLRIPQKFYRFWLKVMTFHPPERSNPIV